MEKNTFDQEGAHEDPGSSTATLVRMGIRALRSTCLSSTDALGEVPLARAVRT